MAPRGGLGGQRLLRRCPRVVHHLVQEEREEVKDVAANEGQGQNDTMVTVGLAVS